jgi:predicted MFS family arabinose efflux permease
MVGMLVATSSGPLWVRRVRWRGGVVTGLALFVLANRLSIDADGFLALYLLRVMAGLACGITYAISLSALAEHALPAQAFALMVVVQTCWGTLGLFLLPRLLPAGGLAAFFDYLDAWLAPLVLLALVAFPDCPPRPVHGTSAMGERIDARRVALMIAGTVAYYTAISAAWSYMERLGTQGGLPATEVGEVLAIGFALSAPAALLAPRVVERFDNATALFGAVALQSAALLALALAHEKQTLALYTAATLLFQCAWCFVLPPLIAGFSAADPGGRIVVLCSPSFKIGEIAGPPLGAGIAAQSGVAAMMIGAALLLPLAVALLVLADRRGGAARLPVRTGNVA